MFKDLSNDDLEEVEIFVKQRLLKCLKSKKKIILNEDTMIQYFGEAYAHDPEQFKFRIGDKKLIRIIIAHVKQMIDDGKINHFKENHKKIEKKEEQIINDGHQICETAHRTYFLLDKLREMANQNVKREKGGYRYDSIIQKFAAFFRMVAGRLAYKTIQNNLVCSLPSLSTVNRYIQTSNSKIFEGILRTEELLLHLNSRKLPLAVSISEDATRIIGRVQYDSSTNQLIGLSLPMNDHNGMPTPFAFPARNASEIYSHFANENSTSNFLNVIMAQPLADVTPFCLTVFGSDNKYTARNVINRWNHIEEELNTLGIIVVSFSSDSDPRYNAAMRYLSMIGCKSVIIESAWFKCGKTSCPFFIQDTTHIATKMRNFFLRTLENNRLLPFGDHFIQLKHLFDLLVNFKKDIHLLTATTLNPVDRQNFASVQKMCHVRVTNLLKAEILNSEATVIFLEMVRDIIESFMNPDLMPLERIRKIWYPLFIIRIWRYFIINRREYKLKENFLTSNCYACVELNAHGLVQIMLELQKIGKEELFIPTLFSSQQCESTFRQLRSFTSTYSTITNCTVKEALSRITKIQMQNDIAHSTSPDLIYPRLGKQKDAVKLHKLPSKKQICDEILNCKSDAITTAVSMKLIPLRLAAKTKSTNCPIEEYKFKGTKQHKISPVAKYKNFSLSKFKTIGLKNYAEKKTEPIPETNSYVEFVLNKKRFVVKKTSFCWLLQDDVQKLSNDRLQRVRAKIGQINIKAGPHRVHEIKKKKRFKINTHRKCKY